MPVEATGQALQKVGDYDLVEKIAEGGMGTVYKGRHRASGQLVAVKVVPPHLLSNSVFLKRFEKEYNAARALDHPNIVRAMDFGHEGSIPFLVMEYVEGETLGQRLEREGRLPEAEALRLISQVAQGLHKAHKLGLIHRDVKPDNILLTAEGQAKLTDLGLVKEIESDLNLTRTGRGLGTPHFMAPEQFRRAKDADIRCDIYSMAATLYQMVTGELPFKACGPLDAWMKKINNEISSPRNLVKDLSERVDWAIRRSMSADPAQRAATCREFVEDLTGQSTRRVSGGTTGIEHKEIWFLVFKDEEGVIHTVKGSTSGVRRSLREGLLGDAANIRISRSKQGPFEGLRHRPEFRDLIIKPSALPLASKKRSTPLPTPVPFQKVSASKVNAPPKIAALPAAASFTVRESTTSTPLPSLPTQSDAPHIRLYQGDDSSEWAKWFLLIFFALLLGVGGYLLMPYLSSLRLF